MIRLSTLGAVDLRRDGEELRPVLLQPKRLAVLVWLSTARPVGYHSRDTMLALFWPDADEERGRNALRQGLHFLRRTLGDDIVLSRGDREVGLDTARFWCDAAAFDAALAARRPEEALELYRGDFLPGFFIDDAPEAERWLEDERDRRRREAVDAALGLVRRDEAAGDLRAAAGWARRAGLIVPADETVHRTLLTLLEHVGDHAAALDAHEQFAKRLDAEYGLPVGKETATIVERIRARPAVAVAARAPVASAGAAVPVVSPPGTSAPALASATPAAPSSTVTTAPSSTVTTAPSSTVTTAAESAPSPLRLLPWLVVAVAVAALASYAALRSRATAASSPVTAIAVLPFDNRTGDGNADVLAEGLADEVINGLGQLQGLRVIARTSSFAWKGKAVGADSIARALHVTHLVEGSLRRAGDSMRVTATLVEARTGERRWSRVWNGSERDLLALETAISRGVAEALSPVLGREAQSNAPETRLPALRERLLRARALSRQINAVQPVLDSLTAIVTADSTYARAWGYLGLYSAFQGYYKQAPAADAYARATSAARRALAIRPDVPEAYLALARVAEFRDWDFREAEQMYRKTVELRPSDARTYGQRTFTLLRLRRVDEATVQARTAVELDPVSPSTWNALGAAHMARQRTDSAIAAFRIAQAFSPNDAAILTNLALAAGERGRFAEGHALVDSAERSAPGDLGNRQTRAWLFAKAGRRAEALAIADSLERTPNVSPMLVAIVPALLGDRARALALLDRAAAERDDRLADLAMVSEFDVLRDEPRFRALEARLGMVER